MDITFSPEAKEKAEEIQASGKILRLKLIKSGCCSYAFVFGESEPIRGDTLIEHEGLKIALGDEAIELMQRVKIDYKRKGLRKGFLVIPN
ncbi:MAG: HesB/IscA family protein [Anaerovoracaceae bacterium]